MFAFQDRGGRGEFLGFELCNEFFRISLEPAAAAAWLADLLAIFLIPVIPDSIFLAPRIDEFPAE